MTHSRPQIACEMKVRKVREFSNQPSYEVLLFQRGDKHWFALQMSNGARALFTAPPANEQEARDVIREFEEKREVAA